MIGVLFVITLFKCNTVLLNNCCLAPNIHICCCIIAEDGHSRYLVSYLTCFAILRDVNFYWCSTTQSVLLDSIFKLPQNGVSKFLFTYFINLFQEHKHNTLYGTTWIFARSRTTHWIQRSANCINCQQLRSDYNTENTYNHAIDGIGHTCYRPTRHVIAAISRLV